MKSLPHILLIEDNDDDAVLMKRALAGVGLTNPLDIVEDGQSAINYLAGTGRFARPVPSPAPAIVFLDLKLPFKSGFEVLEWIRLQPSLRKVVVVVLTSSEEPTDVRLAHKLGANSYLAKPPQPNELMEVVKLFREQLREPTVASSS